MDLLDRIFSSARDTTDTARNRARLAAKGDGSSVGSMLTVGALGAAIGAVGAMLLDPARGRARRARLIDQSAAAVRHTVRRGEQAVRRVRSDVEGKMAAANAARSPEVHPIDDATIRDRVQSIIFRDDSVPKGSLNVNVERGIVVLRGEVPDTEMRERLVKEVEQIEGVWSVRDVMHLPGEPAPTASPVS